MLAVLLHEALHVLGFTVHVHVHVHMQGERMLAVVLHEALHVLGFTHSKMLEMPCPTAPAFNRHQARAHACEHARAREHAHAHVHEACRRLRMHYCIQPYNTCTMHTCIHAYMQATTYVPRP